MLDKKLYPDSEGKKKKKKKKPVAASVDASAATAPPAEGWSAAAAAAVKRQPSQGLLLGGKRGKRGAKLTPEEEERRRFEEAQQALSRPMKPIPLIPDDPNDSNSNQQQQQQHHHHHHGKEDDSDDLEEESSEYEDEPEPPKPQLVVRSVPAKKPMPETPVEEAEPEPGLDEPDIEDEPFDAIENVMSEIEFAHEQSQHKALPQPDDDSIEEVGLPLDVSEVGRAGLNDSVLDWEGVQTDLEFELGEEVSEAALKERDARWKRPPSMLFKIIKKNE